MHVYGYDRLYIEYLESRNNVAGIGSAFKKPVSPQENKHRIADRTALFSIWLYPHHRTKHT